MDSMNEPTMTAAHPHAVSQKPKTSVSAILSLVFGILGLCTAGLTGIVGLVLGVVALIGIKKEEGRLGGKGLAIGGIIVSIITMIAGFLIVISVAIMVPAVQAARSSAYTAMDLSNARQLGTAAMSSTVDNSSFLPNANQWDQNLSRYIPDPSVFESAHFPGQGRYLAMNENLSNKRVSDFPGRTVLFFEVGPGGPMKGGPSDLPPQPINTAGYVVVFLDGSVDMIPSQNVATLEWGSSIAP